MASPSFKPSSTPGMPLFPLSPERVNTRLANINSNGPSVPPSPSLPDLSPSKNATLNSDVQAMVSRFNSLEINDHVELHKRDVAALKRAQMGREEAETELRRCREELRQLKRDVDEGSGRERKVMKRLDVVMEDLHRQKETQASAQTLYEREIRRARKEAFKSSSSLVQVQEDLKSTRASLSVTRTDLETERARGRQRDQDVFAARYELVGVQEDLTKEQQRCKVLESERDALKCRLKEEEVARVASEGMIALPASTPQDSAAQEEDEFASPRKRQNPNHTPRAQSQDISRHRLELEVLRDELLRLSKSKDAAEGQVDFMKMECQFQCCSCRVAEHNGRTFVHDNSFTQQAQQLRPYFNDLGIEGPPAYEDMMLDRTPMAGIDPLDPKHFSHPSTPRPASPTDDPGDLRGRDRWPALDSQGHGEEENIFVSPGSGTFRINNTQHRSGSRTAEQPTALRSLDSNLVTTSRPKVYINSNGHAHEEEHQPKGRHRHESRAEEATGSMTDAGEQENSIMCPNNETPRKRSTGTAIACMGQGNDEETPNTEIDEEDGLDFQDSPTTHIQATTKTTTIPLAPLSSPLKITQSHPMSHHIQPRPETEPEADIPQPPLQTQLKDFGSDQATANAACGPMLSPGGHRDHDSETDNPWTPFKISTLSREEAIERIRARRGRDRERTGIITATSAAAIPGGGSASADATAGAGMTPKRAASHGEGLVSARMRERREVRGGRRDMSAPENAGIRPRR